MNTRTFAALPLLASLLVLSACNRGGDTGESLAGITERATASISERMATESIKLHSGATGAPRAEITPQGDLVIGGEKVPLNAEQRALLMQYRQQIASIAESGAKIGLQGAGLATTAVTELAKGAFSGDMYEAEKRIEAKAEGIEAAAMELCDRLPLLLATQEQLVEAVPQFAPYADLSENDTNDCRHEVAKR